MRVYNKETWFFCKINRCACGDDVISIPNCKECDIHTHWKESGLTLKKYIEANR